MNFIDLGLCSGTKWADCNIGSVSIYEYGKLFKFQEAQKLGYTLPSHRQLYELYSMCSRKWVNKNGVNGCEFTGPNGNTIFMPAAGRIETNGLARGKGTNGFYWSNEPGGIRPGMAWNMMICEDWVTDGCQDYNRGHSVRAVK